MAGKLSDTYRQRKGGQVSGKKVGNAKVVSTGVFAAEEEENERELVLFDLTNKFGPCKGITRLERWERAHKLGLNPPESVKGIILDAEPDLRESLNQSTWENRNI